MEEIQNAVGVIGVCVTVCALLGMLLPNGNIKKAAETGFSILVLCILLAPFVHSDALQNRIFTQENPYDTYTYDADNTQAYRSAVENLITTTLTDEGISVQSVKSEIVLDGTGNVVLQSVSVTISNVEEKEKVPDILQNALEIPPETVTVEGG